MAQKPVMIKYNDSIERWTTEYLICYNLYHEIYSDTNNICKTEIENIMFCIYNIKVIFFLYSFIT